MFAKVAIANRGVAASRLVRAVRAAGAGSVVLCSEADRDLPYVAEADESVVIGPPPPKDSYLHHDRVIEAAVSAGADALHPGWGFLAEDAVFARKLVGRGVAFVGPSPAFLGIMGDKVLARRKLAERGLPCFPATGELTGTIGEKAAAARALGFPLLIKPSGGGGGIGMVTVESEEGLAKALEAAESQALRGFGRGAVYAERLVRDARHVEFQVVCDRHGGRRHLFDRDCSIQRRRQKVIEEAPAPNIGKPALRAMARAAADALWRLGCDHLGTLETLWDPSAPAGDKLSGFGFLEVNPRLQVEHAATEEVTGVDLAALQLALASGERLKSAMPPVRRTTIGHAVEARIYAEDSLRFLPSPGVLKVFRPPSGEGIRVETGYAEGSAVTPFYDPMIAQVIALGDDRHDALIILAEALAAFVVEGVKTNLGFLRLMIEHPDFVGGRVHTGLAEAVTKSPGYKERLAGLEKGVKPGRAWGVWAWRGYARDEEAEEDEWPGEADGGQGKGD